VVGLDAAGVDGDALGAVLDGLGEPALAVEEVGVEQLVGARP